MSETSTESTLYFFPEDDVSAQELRSILAGHDHERKCWAVSHLLRYAQWDDIWTYISREEAREIFDDLDLPETLAQAWARMLKIPAPVG